MKSSFFIRGFWEFIEIGPPALSVKLSGGESPKDPDSHGPGKSTFKNKGEKHEKLKIVSFRETRIFEKSRILDFYT